ncbi:MAG: hypothetical protein KDE27_26745, partial [Planctomycetes bacterium]|nr:hypothetical protein [Planctomycetota bacterium]
ASDVEELDLVASAGGRVVGRVVPAAAIAAFRAAAGGAEQLGLGPRLRLRSTAAAPQVPVPSVEVASDGVFEFAHVPAGEWVLEFDAHTTDVGRAPTRHIAPPLHVRVASTRTEAVEVAIGGIAPADVWAPVLRINGEPAARCELRLQASGLDRDSSAPETVQTDERGVLALRGLRPGRYRLDEAAGGAGGGTVAFDLEPGERRLAALWLSSSR